MYKAVLILVNAILDLLDLNFLVVEKKYSNTYWFTGMTFSSGKNVFLIRNRAHIRFFVLHKFCCVFLLIHEYIVIS